MKNVQGFQPVEALRVLARVIATPVFVICFGFFWVGFIVFLGPVFQAFSFLDGERFDWKEHVADCNKFFREPITKMWHTRQS